MILFPFIRQYQKVGDDILITCKSISCNITGLFKSFVCGLVDRRVDGNVDKVKAESLIFLAVLDKEIKAGAYFGLNMLDGEEFQDCDVLIGKKSF